MKQVQLCLLTVDLSEAFDGISLCLTARIEGRSSFLTLQQINGHTGWQTACDVWHICGHGELVPKNDKNNKCNS